MEYLRIHLDPMSVTPASQLTAGSPENTPKENQKEINIDRKHQVKIQFFGFQPLVFQANLKLGELLSFLYDTDWTVPEARNRLRFSWVVESTLPTGMWAILQ